MQFAKYENLGNVTGFWIKDYITDDDVRILAQGESCKMRCKDPLFAQTVSFYVV